MSITIATGDRNAVEFGGIVSKFASHGENFATFTLASADADGKVTRIPCIANAPFANIVKEIGDGNRVSILGKLQWNVWQTASGEQRFTLQIKVVGMDDGEDS